MLLDGIREALRLIATLDREVVDIVVLSLQVSLAATLISTIGGVAAGTALALVNFPGRRIVVSLVNTGMGMPPVVVGLFVTLLLWRSGPLGRFELLFTPSAIIIAQTVIAMPIVTGISLAAIQQLPPKLRDQILALGATRLQMVWMLMRQARLPLLAAVMAGLGGVLSEVGAAVMVGGNIKGQTRVLTTATVIETSKGNFETAIAFGLILLLVTFLLNAGLTHIQQRNRPR